MKDPNLLIIPGTSGVNRNKTKGTPISTGVHYYNSITNVNIFFVDMKDTNVTDFQSDIVLDSLAKQKDLLENHNMY
jgi:hypothetical protein